VFKKKNFTNKKWLGFLLFIAVIFGTIWAVYDQDLDFPVLTLQPPQCKELHSLTGEKPFRFIAFGDFGSGMPFQRRLALEMVRTYQKTPFHTALLLGDNLYPDGDVGKLALANFERPYQFLLAHQVRFIAALGNHDVRHNHKVDGMRYFGMPAEYYKATQGPVDFFILNTIDFTQNLPQQAWLEKTLSESHAPWKIVIAHHPILSSGDHGGNRMLRAQLQPILLRHHVDFYLSGHDHDYERFKDEGALHLVVSGGGGAFLYPFKKILPSSIVHARTHNFLLFEILDKQLVMKAINKAGQVIDCVTVNKP
jgi:hypothetical protein